MNMDNTLLGRISGLLTELDGEAKAAAVKSATELDLSGSGSKDPGSKGGKTSHPTGKLDGNSGPAVLGSRGKENEADLKDAYTAGVDNTSPSDIGGQDDKQYNIGAHQSATGEDPSVEDDYKGTTSDPGTSHPADASRMGEKYSSMRFPALVKLAYSKMNDSLALLANGESVSANRIDETKLAAQAGYELADALTSGGVGQDKTAAVQALFAGIIKEAEQDADNVGQLMHAYRELQKQAEAGMDPAMMEGTISPEGSGAGPEAGPPGGAPSGSAGGVPMMPGGEGGHGEPDGDEGGMPDMGGGMGGEGGEGGGDHQAAVEELLNALMELGISPEQLGAVAQGAHGGEKAASVLDPRLQKMAAHLATKHPGEIEPLYRMATWSAQLRDSGQAKIKTATGRQRQERDEIKNYLREACGIR
jgi:uncharacterized protein YbjQ (UPF0145 family)